MKRIFMLCLMPHIQYKIKPHEGLGRFRILHRRGSAAKAACCCMGIDLPQVDCENALDERLDRFFPDHLLI